MRFPQQSEVFNRSLVRITNPERREAPFKGNLKKASRQTYILSVNQQHARLILSHQKQHNPTFQ